MTGLNLTENYELVVAISRTVHGGDDQLEFDDFLQDVCLKILKLNAGSSPYDAEKARRSTYVHMIAKGVYLKGFRGEPDPEPREDLEEDEGFFGEWNRQTRSAFKVYLKEQTDFEDVLPRRVFVLLDMGYTREEISRILDQTMYQVRKQKSRLVDIAGEFLQRLDT